MTTIPVTTGQKACLKFFEDMSGYHDEIFWPPLSYGLLSIMTAAGAQILGMMSVAMVAVLSRRNFRFYELHPHSAINQRGLGLAMIFAWPVTGLGAGYFSARFRGKFKNTNWQTHTASGVRSSRHLHRNILHFEPRVDTAAADYGGLMHLRAISMHQKLSRLSGCITHSYLQEERAVVRQRLHPVFGHRKGIPTLTPDYLQKRHLHCLGYLPTGFRNVPARQRGNIGDFTILPAT